MATVRELVRVYYAVINSSEFYKMYFEQFSEFLLTWPLKLLAYFDLCWHIILK